MSDGGKGSSPRPFSVSNEEYAKRWDMIFGRDVIDESKKLFEGEMQFDESQKQLNEWNEKNETGPSV